MMLTVNRCDDFSAAVSANCKAMLKGESYRAVCLLAFSQSVCVELGWTVESGATPAQIFASAKSAKTLRGAKAVVLDRPLPGVKNAGEGTFGSFLHASEQIVGLWPALFDGHLVGFEPTGEAGEVRITNSASLRRAFQSMDAAVASIYKEKSGAPKKGAEKTGETVPGGDGGPEETVRPAAPTSAPGVGGIDVNAVQAMLRTLFNIDPDGTAELLAATFHADFLLEAASIAGRRDYQSEPVVETITPESAGLLACAV